MSFIPRLDNLTMVHAFWPFTFKFLNYRYPSPTILLLYFFFLFIYFFFLIFIFFLFFFFKFLFIYFLLILHWIKFEDITLIISPFFHAPPMVYEQIFFFLSSHSIISHAVLFLASFNVLICIPPPLTVITILLSLLFPLSVSHIRFILFFKA